VPASPTQPDDQPDSGETTNRACPSAPEPRHLIHAAHSVAQPDVYLEQRNGTRLLCKDFSARPWLCRVLFSRPVAHREYRVLTRLQGLTGVPRVETPVNDERLYMEFIDGPGALVDTTHARPDQIPPAQFFTDLKRVLHAVHERGVTHGDIRRGNVLRDQRGQPCLIDFATALDWNRVPRFLRQRLAPVLEHVDILAVLKLQRHYHPDSLTPEEARLLDHQPWYIRFPKFLRKRVYRGLIKQKDWRKRWGRLRAACSGAKPPAANESESTGG